MSGGQGLNFETLVDDIYEAALVPEAWPRVLDQLSVLSDSAGGVLFAVPAQSWKRSRPNEPASRWVSSSSIERLWQDFVTDGWSGERNIWFHRVMKVAAAGFVADEDLFSDEEREDEPQYKWFRAKGYGAGAGLLIPTPTTDILYVGFERQLADRLFDRATLDLLDRFKPHLSRSALLSARIGLERLQASADSLACLGLPAAILSSRHRILAANDLLDEFIPASLNDAGVGRLRLTHGGADRLFERALAALASSAGRETATTSIAIPAVDDRPAMVVHLLPIVKTARDIFTAASSIMIITPVRPAVAPTAQMIQGLYDLTAAEARIARMISRGMTIKDIAITTTIKEGTVRCQLKSIFAKTGVTRQAALVSLLGGLRLPCG